MLIMDTRFSAILAKAVDEEIDAGEALYLLEHSAVPARALMLFAAADQVHRAVMGDRLHWTAGMAQFLPCRLPILCRYCTSFTNRPLSRQTMRRAIAYVEEAGIPDMHLSGGTNPAGYDEEVLGLVREIREFSDISLEVNLGPSIKNPETLRELKDLGVTSITCSLETNNEDLFRRVKPGDDLSARRNLLHMAGAGGLKTNGMMLVGLGETPADRIEHIFFLKKVPGFVNLRLSRFFPFPGTQLDRRPRTSPWEVARLMAVARLVWRRLDIGGAAGNSVDDLPLYLSAGGGNRVLGIHVQERRPQPAPGVKVVELGPEAVLVDCRTIIRQYAEEMGFVL